MKSICVLFWGVIRSPRQAFLKARETRPLRESFFMMLGAFFLTPVALYYLGQLNVFPGKVFPFGQLLAVWAPGFFLPFIIAGALHYIAKASRLESTYVRMLIVVFMAHAPYVLLIPAQVLLIALKLVVSHTSFLFQGISWGMNLWAAALAILGASIMVSVSAKKAFAVCLRVFLILVGLCVVAGMIFGLLKSDQRRVEHLAQGIAEQVFKAQQEALSRPSPQDLKVLGDRLKELAPQFQVTIDSVEEAATGLKVTGSAPTPPDLFRFFDELKKNQWRPTPRSLQKRKDNTLEFEFICSGNIA